MIPRGDPLPDDTYEKMTRKAERGHLAGAADLLAITKGTLAFGILEQMHKEYAANPTLGIGQHNWITQLAESNVDWKAWAGTLGAIVIKQSVQRMIHGFRQHDDIPKEIARLENMTAGERRRERWAHRIGNIAVTTAVGVGAYTAAEHQSMAHVMITNGIAIGGALVNLFRAERRANKRTEQRLEAWRRRSPFAL